MMQLSCRTEVLLGKHSESGSRKLAAHARIIVPVYSQVCLFFIGTKDPFRTMLLWETRMMKYTLRYACFPFVHERKLE